MHIERVLRKDGRIRTHRVVVDHVRIGGRRRRTVLNLGVHFHVPRSQWKLLCFKVEGRVRPHSEQLTFDFGHSHLDPVVSDIARRLQAQWKAAGLSPQGDALDPTPPVTDAYA